MIPKFSSWPLFSIGLGLSLVLTPVPGQALEPGDRVLGQWSDNLWYPARIQSVQGSRIYLNFDDGDVAVVRPVQVRFIDWGPGTRLQCNWQNQGKYYSGVIAQMSGEQISVNYDDGDRERITISRCRSR